MSAFYSENTIDEMLAGSPIDSGEFWCESRKCAMRGRVVTLLWREEPITGRHYPLCPTCGDVLRENVSAPNVIWCGEIDHRYRDKTKDGYFADPGQTVYTRNTPDGKPKALHLSTWQDVKEHCKREGLRDPRECGNNIQVAEDGKKLLNTCGMPGTEV